VIGRGDVALVDALRETIRPLREHDPLDALVDAVGDARIVLLGGSTHGTREFHAERARLTRRLVREKGFGAIAVEAGWPDAFRVNRFVRGLGTDPGADAALSGLGRFPGWAWRNREVLAFVRWLRARNDALPAGDPRVGFYGLDLHGLHASIEAVLRFLDAIDPGAARAARERYRCLDAYRDREERYAERAGSSALASCEDAVVDELVELLRRARRAAGDPEAAEAWFDAVQNARAVVDAEAYYRTMYRGSIAAWNLRERHMADALDAVLAHLDRFGRGKVVVWEHSAHAGDARATELGRRGELSAGQVVRARHGDDAFLAGFTTWAGTVTAATRWGGPPERQRVRPALGGSYEALFHALGTPRFAIDLRTLGEAASSLKEARLERVIGALHTPGPERQGEYVAASLPSQFDAAVHIDVTTAVEPLDPSPVWDHRAPRDASPSAV
jgi:erythromycin esterase-like protein